MLLWWTANVSTSSPLFPPIPTAFLTTDASDSGWGASVNGHPLSGTWTGPQQRWHINRKELHAVRLAISRHASRLRGSTVLLQSDSKTVVAYVQRQGGTKSLGLLEEVEALLLMTHRSQILLTARFIPGVYNTLADSLSRRQVPPEWHLSSRVTADIFDLWGTPEFDLFATHSSAVVPQYASLDQTDLGASFIDAFSRQWTFTLAWIFPPPALVPRVLHHLNSAVGSFILVAPRWEKTFWLPDLQRRALLPPYIFPRLHSNLIDLSTGRPPPQASDLCLEAWKVRGGPPK